MLTRRTALSLVRQHLGDGPRARHSVFVGYVMASLATLLGEDAGLWEVTGLCHDLDFEVISQDRCRHGMVAGPFGTREAPVQAALLLPKRLVPQQQKADRPRHG